MKLRMPPPSHFVPLFQIMLVLLLCPAAQSSLPFGFETLNFSTGSGPTAASFSDLNGDEFADLVVAHQSDTSISVLLGQGDGTFLEMKYALLAEQISLALSDINLDGAPDIIASLQYEDITAIALLLGVGDGTFQEPIYHYLEDTTAIPFIAVGDIDGNGTPDIVVPTATDLPEPPWRDNTISILLNWEDGSFQTELSQELALPSDWSIALLFDLGDLNNDGSLDLVVGGSGFAKTMIGNGDGTFSDMAEYNISADFTFVKTEYLNADNFLDVIVTDGMGGRIYILLGDGAGALQQSATYEFDTFTFGLPAVADFDEDGYTDMAMIEYSAPPLGCHDSSSMLHILLGNGDGTFSRIHRYLGAPGRVIAVADVNRDTHFDLAIPNDCLPTEGRLYLGHGDGSFPAPTYQDLGIQVDLTSLVFTMPGYFTNDFQLDLCMFDQSTHIVHILQGAGDGTFTLSSSTQVELTASWYIKPIAADLNSDGYEDIILSNMATDNNLDIVILMNNNAGGFDTPIYYTLETMGIVALVEDFDTDGNADILTLDMEGLVWILGGNGDGTFRAPVTTETFIINLCTFPTKGHFDSDSSMDLAYLDCSTNEIMILLGNADGTFTQGGAYVLPSVGATGLESGDVNLDGVTDLFVLDNTSIQVLFGVGNGTFVLGDNYQAEVSDTIGLVPAINLSDINLDGFPDIIINSSQFFDYSRITLLLNEGDGSFAPPEVFSVPTLFLPSVLVEDVNGDYSPDLVMTFFDWSKAGLLVYLNTAENTLEGTIHEQADTQETLRADMLSITDPQITGELDAIVSATDFEIVTVTTGSFSGSGFAKASVGVHIAGQTYSGALQAMTFTSPTEGRIYIRGTIVGGLYATVDGYLYQSDPGSGTYDRYNGTWDIGRLGGFSVSSRLEVTAIVQITESVYFPSTELCMEQLSISGYYQGPIDFVSTGLQICDDSNPYSGDGFSIISYTTDSGFGEAWSYSKIISANRVSHIGLFSGVHSGIGILTVDQGTIPQSAFLALMRVDTGLPPMPDLEISTWGPGRVSPGQTVSYVIECQNSGVMPAEDVIVMSEFPLDAEFVSCTNDCYYDPQIRAVFWSLNALQSGSNTLLSYTLKYRWGLIMNTQQDVQSRIGILGYNEVDSLLRPEFTPFAPEWFENIELSKPALSDKLYEFLGLLGQFLGRHDSDLLDDYSITENTTATENFQKVLDVLRTDPGHNFDDTVSKLEHLMDTQKIFLDPTLVHDAISIQGYGRIEIHPTFSILGHNFDYTQPLEQLDPPMQFLFCAYQAGVLVHEIEHLTTRSRPKGSRDPNFDERKSYLSQLRSYVILALNVMGSGGEMSKAANYALLAEDALGRYRNRYADYGQLGTETFEQLIQEAKACLNINDLSQSDWNTFEAKFISTRTLAELYLAIFPISEESNRSVKRSTISTAHDPNIKYGPEGDISAGQRLTYTVEYENEGEGIAFGVYFTDSLDIDLDASTLEIGPVISTADGSILAPVGEYDEGTRTITWFVGEVGPGEGGYAEISINVRGDAEPGTEVINYATVYFPSVPEVTRTNAIVSVIPTNRPPVADAGSGQTIAVGADCMGTVTLDGSSSYDPDGDSLSYLWTWDGGSATGVNPTITLPLGMHNVDLVVNDGTVDSESAAVSVTVVDQTPPELSMSVSPDVLWPPNHKMQLITPTISVDDNCGSDPVIQLKSITMNEGDQINTYDPSYDATVVEGNTSNDIEVDANGDIWLRAERAGTGVGRVYTIIYEATDTSGNTTTGSAIVTVPHDQG